MKLLSFLSLGILLSFGASASINDAWEGFSAPEILGSGLTHKFNELPLKGSLDVGNRAWSGDYWSTKKGSINYRWNAPVKIGYDLNSPSKAEAMRMSLDQLATLAPSEKYDLLMGRYDYPFVKEVDGVASPRAQIWNGICHGWSPATLNHSEPTPKVLTNPDGIQIPFGSGDIKALLSYYYAEHHKGDAGQMGLRCFFGRWTGGPRGCHQDLNAGAFHIILANQVGLKKEGFVMDIERWREVWNHPVIGYETVLMQSEEPSIGAASSAVRTLLVKTYVTHADGSAPTWETVRGTDNQKVTVQTYTYRIELDAAGKIVGGSWESANRPDFLWNVTPVTEFTGIMSGLPVLLND